MGVEDAPMIFPPPALRNIVDKTASFVAKNGLEFADKIRKEKERDAKFNFLTPGDPYHVYYRQKVQDFLEGKAELTGSAAAVTAESEKKAGQTDAALEPPAEYEFVADAPTTSAQDLDIVRLTARFVAQNGRAFMSSLMQREARNWQFDFMKPTHPLHPYFSALIDQYNKVIRAGDSLKKTLQEQTDSRFKLFDKVQYTTNFLKQKQRVQKEQEEAEAAEQTAYQQIDWHDFVVVQSLEFTAFDTDLPAPIKKPQLATRLIEELKFERMQLHPDIPGMEPAEEEDDMEVEEPTAVQQPPQPAELAGAATTEEEEMDIDGATAPHATAKPSAATEAEEEITIKSYDPRASRQAEKKGAETFLISPLTGERIPASQYAEHMRISLLVPDQAAKRPRLTRRSATRLLLGN
jgi:splicing factor 3A subunit 1